MIVTNKNHETAIVIRRDGVNVSFVRLKAGKLGCERMDEAAFRENWHESPYPLPETIERSWPRMRLTRLDLPTFGRPTTAI